MNLLVWIALFFSSVRKGIIVKYQPNVVKLSIASAISNRNRRIFRVSACYRRLRLENDLEFSFPRRYGQLIRVLCGWLLTIFSTSVKTVASISSFEACSLSNIFIAVLCLSSMVDLKTINSFIWHIRCNICSIQPLQGLCHLLIGST